MRAIMNGITPTLLTQSLVSSLISSFNFLVTHYLAYFEVGGGVAVGVCVTQDKQTRMEIKI